MQLEHLKHALEQHEIVLSMGENGRIKYDAPAPVPVTVLNALRANYKEISENLPLLDIAQTTELQKEICELHNENGAGAKTVTAKTVTAGPPRCEDGRLDMGAILATPGHCGNCTHWQPLEDWGPLMGRCLALHLYSEIKRPALAIHAGHKCVCKGWRPTVAPRLAPANDEK